ncbi:hypothetical protein A2108_00780 [Candidatus Wolfebacteria bacterium GWA1_42_9]|uniref:Uncharacterized protein n=1 Tax=Candidatus Wolfebacteria bacterium GWA1_42_9 TaxID=1802553 RepID=A0A1F8DL19_9BACT|nr:MAG: hypothetical protein A2108_00780 [Candidatus Wolfebacteria bacterium GWA1_42_9]
MNLETRQCQNCHNDFVIEPDDFDFYKKIDVPAPTWCLDCRMQRRFSFRNERHLYKRKEALGGKEIISIYSPDKLLKVYSHKDWWSDKWNPDDYKKEIDFSKPFFGQFKKLLFEFPWAALFNTNSVNSDYCNYTTDNKDCYLVFGGDFNENCCYSTFNFHSKDTADVYWVERCQLCYETTDSKNCYRVFFSKYARDCNNSMFLFYCSGCSNCVGCVGLRNKSYCIFNQQYTKEEYEKKMGELGLNSRSGIQEFKRKMSNFVLKFPHRYAQIIKSVNSSGDNIVEGKNCKRCFEITGPAEDLKDIFLGGLNGRDLSSCDHLGHGVELAYDSWAAFGGSSNIAFSLWTRTCHNIRYSYALTDCSDCFGCVGLRNKQYRILNKQYAKNEYEALVPKIIQHMNDVPYLDSGGRIYRYGEFFPAEFSPFAYNETIAQEYFPLNKKDCLEKGYQWKDLETKNYQATINPEELPDKIEDVSDDILNQIVGCAHKGECDEQCTTAFKITSQELQFYRQMNLPLPVFCPNCRHYQRMKQRNPIKLWHRKCQCAGKQSENGVYTNTIQHQHGDSPCSDEFETSYSPERPEIVYCEQCYNTEVA